MPYVTRPMKYEDCHAIAHMREFMMDASEPQLKKVSERLLHLKKPGDEKPGLVPNVYGYVTEYSPSWADINNTMIVSCAMLFPTFSLTEGEKRLGDTDRYDYRVVNLMTNPGHRKSGCAEMCLEMSLASFRALLRSKYWFSFSEENRFGSFCSMGCCIGPSCPWAIFYRTVAAG